MLLYSRLSQIAKSGPSQSRNRGPTVQIKVQERNSNEKVSVYVLSHFADCIWHLRHALECLVDMAVRIGELIFRADIFEALARRICEVIASLSFRHLRSAFTFTKDLAFRSNPLNLVKSSYDDRTFFLEY